MKGEIGMEGLIRKMLQESGDDDLRLAAAIESLALRYGDEVYQEAWRCKSFCVNGLVFGYQ